MVAHARACRDNSEVAEAAPDRFSTPPEDAMRVIRKLITTNVRLNTVVHTGVPGFKPRARS